MADNKAPVKATMAPAARNPEGEAPITQEDGARSMKGLTDTELQTLQRRVMAELQRRGSNPAEPSFGMSEGTRQELLQREALRDSDPEVAAAQVVSSPFTGAPVEGDGSPRERAK